MPTPLYNLVAAVSWPVIHGAFRLEVHGKERLPAEGGFVLAANHNSNFDPWALGLPLWPRRQLFFMGKVELFNPVLGPILRSAGAFPVRRGEADIEAIQAAVRICQEGGIVAMFPEGTRRTKGLRKKFEHRPRTGSARIALSAGVPLVPTAVDGTERLTRLGKWKIAYGDPVRVDDLAALPARQAQHEATSRLMEQIYALHDAL